MYRKSFASISLAILAVIGIVISQERYLVLSSIPGSRTSYQSDEDKTRASLSVQKLMPHLGFENTIVDWQYLQFIQYYGDSNARNITGYGLVTDYFKSVINNDPRFLSAFFVMATANSVFAAQPVVSVELADKVIDNIWPTFDDRTPFVWTYKGIDELLFLGNTKSAQRSYEMAAEWALAQNRPESTAIAEHNLETASFLSKNPDSRRAQIGAWVTILSSTSDAKTQKRAIEEIKALGGTISISPEGQLNVKVPEGSQ